MTLGHPNSKRGSGFRTSYWATDILIQVDQLTANVNRNVAVQNIYPDGSAYQRCNHRGFQQGACHIIVFKHSKVCAEVVIKNPFYLCISKQSSLF